MLQRIRIILLSLSLLGFCPGVGGAESAALNAPSASAAPSFETALREFVGQNDKYIGRRFNQRFPSLYAKLVSVCCLKDGGKRAEVRWWPRPGGQENLCRAVFLSRQGKIVDVKLEGTGCAP